MKVNKNEYEKIKECFFNIIGYITMILQYDSYSEAHDDYQKVLDKITEMLILYEEKRNIALINEKELLYLYNKLDTLQTEYICNKNLGNESELSDYVVNWMWNLMYIRKTIIEGCDNNGRGK